MFDNSVKYWKLQISDAEKKRKKVEETVKLAKDYVKGKHFTKADELTGDTLAVVNYMIPYFKIMLSGLYYRNPKVIIYPAENGTEIGANILSVVTNYYLRELKIKKTNKLIIGNALLQPFSVAKLGYITTIGEEIYEEEITEPINPIVEKYLPTFAKLLKPKKSKIIKTNEYIKDESPFIKRIKAENILIDPNADIISEARWVGEKIYDTAWNVKNTKRYKNLDKLEPILKLKGEGEEEKNAVVILYALQVKEKDNNGKDKIRIKVFADACDDYLYDDYSVYPIDGFQYSFLNFNEVDDSDFDLLANINLFKSVQDNKNKIRSRMMTMVDKFMAKLGYDINKIPTDQLEALKNGGFGAAVGCNGDPTNALKIFMENVFPAELYKLDDKTDEDWVSTTGLTKAKMIGVSEAETLGEAKIGESAADRRESEMGDTVDDFLQDEMRKFVQIIKKFVPTEKMMAICGQEEIRRNQDLIEGWKLATAEEIQAEYDVDVEMRSSRPPNVEAKRVIDMTMLKMLVELKETLAQEGKPIMVYPIVRNVLKDAEYKNIDEIMPATKAQEPLPEGEESLESVLMQMMLQGGI